MMNKIGIIMSQMKNLIKDMSINCLLNLILFFLMILFIQNAKIKRSIDFISYKTVPLPISFIVGSSFILGSFNGGLLVNFLGRNKK